MDIRITKEKARIPVSVIHVIGNIDSVTAAEFQAKAEAEIQGGARYVLIDLSQVPFLSSAGLRALNNIFTTLRTLSPDVSEAEMRAGINAGTYKSPHLKLLNPTKPCLVALENSGFSMFLEVLTDSRTAVAAF